MKRLIKFGGLGVMILCLAGCRMGEDAVVTQDLPNGEKKCWLLYDQQITHADNGALRWRNPYFGDDFTVHSVRGNTDIVRSGAFTAFHDINAVAKEMGIEDPSKCMVVKNGTHG